MCFLRTLALCSSARRIASSRLEYHLPVNGSVFLNTNITYSNNATYLDHFTGSLLVAVNDDVSVPDGVVYVTMHHTNKGVGNATNVCLMETSSGSGLYIFVRLLFSWCLVTKGAHFLTTGSYKPQRIRRHKLQYHPPPTSEQHWSPQY